MMHAKRMSRIVLALLPLVGAAAHAQEAFTRQPVNVRAGPDRSYPMVSQLGPGAPVQVMGCLEDWSWCDVGFDDNRGWVYGPFLLYGVTDDRVPLYTYGPSLGIAVIGFSLGSYWDDHYRQRSWYGEREQWSHREPPPHRAPTGLPPHAVYRPGMHPSHDGPARARAEPDGRPQQSAPGSTRGSEREAQQVPARGPERTALQHTSRGTEQAAPAGSAPGPEHAPAGARPAERGTAPGAEAGQRTERTAEPQPNRSSPPKEMQHAPVGARESEGQKQGESGAERGGEKPGREENR